MLVRFGVTNFGKFTDPIELSFLATDPPDQEGPVLFEGFGGEEMIPGAGNHAVLPFLLVFGKRENTAGELNRAVKSMVQQISQSGRPSPKSKALVKQSLELKGPSSKKPTEFEIDIAERRVRYRYGFSFNEGRYQSEWLYRFSGDSKEVLLKRDGNSMRVVTELTEEAKELRGQLGPRTLALSAVQQTEGLLRKIRRTITLYSAIGGEDDAQMQRRIARRWDRRVLPFLQLVDPEIKGYGPSNQASATNAPEANLVEFIYDRNRRGGRRVPFEEAPERLRRWLHLLTFAFRAIDTGTALFVDHLEAEIGDDLARSALELFSDWRLNWSSAQLVATASSFGLVQSTMVRRDQVRIQQQRPDGTASIYPLSAIDALDRPPLKFAGLAGLYGRVDIPGDSRSLFSVRLRWNWPAIHDKVIGRAKDGKRLWPFRKRIEFLLYLCRWVAKHPEIPAEERKKVFRTQWAQLNARAGRSSRTG